VLVIAATLGLWQLLSGPVLPAYAVSSPGSVATGFASFVTSSTGWVDIRTSLIELLLGFAIGEAAGFIVGVSLAAIKPLGDIFQPVVAALNGIPTVALAPLLLLIIGIGMLSKVMIAALVVFFVMFNLCFTGMQGLDRKLMDTVRLLGGGRRYVLSEVIVPGLWPTVISGLRAGVPFAMIGVIVGEFVSASAGVGYYILGEMNNYDATGAFTGIIVLLVVILISNSLFTAVERRTIRWRNAG
jgi:NitT/TauT family transport system permease protein